MSYQAVVRDASDNLATSQNIGMQISILQGSSSGTAVYVETQTPTTNANGLVSIEIGAGTIVSGDFTTIDWANGPYFIKTETDPTGGTSYTITGTSQLLSVPYALHAKTAESVSGTITETDPVFTAWDKTTGISITESQISDLDHFTTADETDPIYGASVASGITGTDTTNWNNKLDSETDPVFTAWDKTTGISITESQISDLDHFTTADETDPIYGASVASGITGTDTTNWNNKLDSETDPVFTAWDKTTGISITESQISDLDHFTTADETDPIYGASVASGITGTDTTNWNNKLDSETDPVFTAWDKDYADLSNIPAAADGSETKVTAGTNVTVTGAGTTASPYVINSTAGGSGTHYLGEEYLGGIIYYLYTDNTGTQKGLIVSKTESTATWSGSTLVNANKTSNGAYNMALMPTGAGTARTWVETLGAGWYLPSVDELSLLWHNRFHVNNSSASGLTLLSTAATYWSSTEYAAPNAFSFDFFIGHFRLPIRLGLIVCVPFGLFNNSTI
jgi:hypothetical protein